MKADTFVYICMYMIFVCEVTAMTLDVSALDSCWRRGTTKMSWWFQVFSSFYPKPWGFMIQFDERAYVSNGLVKNQQRDNELLVAILSIILSGVTLILIGSGSEIFRKKKRTYQY